MRESRRRYASLVVALAVLAATSCGANNDPAPAATSSSRSATSNVAGTGRPLVLVFTRTMGFHHDSIVPATKALDVALRARQFEVEVTDDPSAFTDARLASVAIVVFLSTTGDVLDVAQEAALERWVRNGGGWAGVHSALDTEHTWPFYETLVGARFASHPAVQPATVRVEDPAHAAMNHLPAVWSRTDEWYNTSANPRTKVHVLASVDESTYVDGAMGADHPIAWCHRVGQGQAFVTAMGHTNESWSEPAFVDHVVAGIVSVDQPEACATT